MTFLIGLIELFIEICRINQASELSMINGNEYQI